jgi:hypothetical protein
MDDMMRSMPDLPGSKAWRDELKQITDAQILDRVDVVDELLELAIPAAAPYRWISPKRPYVPIVTFSVVDFSKGTVGVPTVDAAFDSNCTPGCTVLTCSCTAVQVTWSSTSYAFQPLSA